MKTPSPHRLRILSILIFVSALLTASANGQSPTLSPGANIDAAGETAVHLTIGNPAAVHCRDMGYKYEIVGDDGQRGICTLPDGKVCDAWEFLQGTCGQSYSYCAQQGFEIRTASDGKDPFSPEYAVCVTSEGVVIGSVTELSNLTEQATGCGGETPGREMPPTFEEEDEYVPPLDGDPPASFDWRNYLGSDWMTPIKNQGGCGSCWAFSAVGVTELGYIRDAGIPDESCMSYVDGSGCTCDDGTCDSVCTYNTGGSCSDRACSNRCIDWSSRLVYIVSTRYVSADPQTIKQALVDTGPLAVSMGIGSPFGGYWDGDIYRCTNDSSTNHAVAIVGYNDAGGYWWVRNSWGTGWGDNGYFKLGYGECYVERYVYYAEAGPPDVGPLEYHSHTIDDDTSENSNGNGDGIANCGEDIELYVDLLNQGTDTATGVNATISTTDPYVTWLFNTDSDYLDIPGGGTVTNNNDFDFALDASAPDGHVIHFDLDIAASNGGPWSDTFDLPVKCSTACNDPGEPNDEPGQAVPISYGTVLTERDICPAGDVDYYSFSGEAGDTIIAGIDAQTIGSSLDSYVYLYDTDGVTELTHNDDFDGLDSWLAYRLPAAGTYYLMVREYSHPREGGPEYAYQISLEGLDHTVYLPVVLRKRD
jgi:putative hemolysin